MKIKSYVSYLFWLIIFLAGTQYIGAQELSVDEAVRIALDNNLSLARSALDVQSRQRTSENSWNSLLPTFNAGAMISHPTSVTGPIEPAARDVWTPGFSLSAGLNFSVSVIDNIKKARADYELGLLTYEASSLELELQVRKLFYQILVLDANVQLSQQNFESARARHEQASSLARLGQASRLDEMSARVDMENLRPQVTNAQMLYENALDSFKTILGMPADTDISLTGSISAEKTVNLSGVNYDGGSLEMAALQKSIASMEAQKNAIFNSAYVPSLRLSWNSMPQYNINNEIWNDNGSFSISLGINLDNFFPWSGAKTQINNLSDNIQSAKLQAADTERNRNNRINQHIRTVERILESLEAMQLNVELAQSAYEMYQDAYRRGTIDYQQLRGAADSLEQAKNRLLQEQYNLIASVLDLEKELNVPFGTILKEVVL